MAELRELAMSAGAEVAGSTIQLRNTANPATLLGRGKVDEIIAQAAALNAEVILIDFDLSPTQQRNLEKITDLKVIDRTQLILDIFASRARTREGRLQVELAQLNYLLPRLSGKGVAMSRLGGGIGTRGPGETKLETDRRRIQKRIKTIEQGIEKVRAGRALHRHQRQAVPLPTLALVGYTNAGKSTLFNRLTHSEVLADRKMFATLDPTVRALVLPSRRKVLLSDTVGFIRNLPTTLVHAFRATLEEVADAALIIHVVDASSEQAPAQTSQVFKVLGEIGVGEVEGKATAQILVLNKSDRLPPEEASLDILRQRTLSESSQSGQVPAALISGLTGEGIPELLTLIDQAIPSDLTSINRFRIPAGQGAEISLLHEMGKVLDVEYHDDVCEIEAAVPPTLRDKLSSYIVSSSS